MPPVGGRSEALRRPVNVSMSEALMAAAKELDINISRAAETGVEAAVKKAREEKWLAENREAIEEHNAWIERRGLILEEYRQF